MSFLSRRSRHSIGRFHAESDPDGTPSADDGDTGPAGRLLAAHAYTGFARLTDSDLRAVAGRAVVTDSFSDGLPIRMSLD